MRGLCGVPNHELVIRHLVCGDHAPRLHGDWRKPLIDEPFLHDHVGVLECLFRVSAFKAKLVADIVGEFVIEPRARRIHGLFRIDHCGQRLVVDFDQVRGVASNVLVLRDDRGNRFSYKTRFAYRQQLPLRVLHIRHRDGARYRTAMTRYFLAGNNGDHTWKLLRL